MDLKPLRTFFGWCTIFNGGLLTVYAVMISLAGDFIYGIHRHWFPVPRDSFYGLIYGLLGFYKILFLVFNLFPYLALVLIDRHRKPVD